MLLQLEPFKGVYCARFALLKLLLKQLAGGDRNKGSYSSLPSLTPHNCQNSAFPVMLRNEPASSSNYPPATGTFQLYCDAETNRGIIGPMSEKQRQDDSVAKLDRQASSKAEWLKIRPPQLHRIAAELYQATTQQRSLSLELFIISRIFWS